MNRKIKISELPEFDMAEHLPDEQAIPLHQHGRLRLSEGGGGSLREVLFVCFSEADLARYERLLGGGGVTAGGGIS